MPYGDPPGGPYPASGGRVRPVEFWQRVLCVYPVTVAANVKKLKKALSKAKKIFWKAGASVVGPAASRVRSDSDGPPRCSG